MGEESPRATEGQPAYDAPGDPLREGSDYADADSPRVFKIVLTGGPCGGKTTALAMLSEFFRTNGFRVFTVPEAATTLWTNGVALPDILSNEDTRFWFQHTILSFQLSLEDGVERIARTIKKPAVLLCDRGTLDGSAYMEKAMWEALLKSKGMDLMGVREGRYDAVFHLVTAAFGAEAYYTLANNPDSRTETLEEAREVDLRSQAVWNGHPRHFVIDNSTCFEGKMERLQQKAAQLVGLPHVPSEPDRFWLKSAPDFDAIPVPYETVSVKKVLLLGGGGPSRLLADGRRVTTEYTFVEERSYSGASAYAHTSRRCLDNGHQSENKRIISAREFASRVNHNADPSKPMVKQTRFSFLWEQQVFIIIRHEAGPGEPIFSLRRQAGGSSKSFPPFLDVGEAIESDDELPFLSPRAAQA